MRDTSVIGDTSITRDTSVTRDWCARRAQDRGASALELCISGSFPAIDLAVLEQNVAGEVAFNTALAHAGAGGVCSHDHCA